MTSTSTAKYHDLREDRRDSIASADAEDVRLLPSLVEPLAKGAPGATRFSFPPTMLLRFVVFVLCWIPFHLRRSIVVDASKAAAVFLVFAMVRNAHVFLIYMLRYSRRPGVSVQLQIGQRTFPLLSGSDQDQVIKPTRRAKFLNLAVDMAIIVGGLVASGVWLAQLVHRRWTYGGEKPGIILAITGFAVYLLSVVDLGRPDSITLSFKVATARNEKTTREPLIPEIVQSEA
ncbi:MAG: hypothetical protein M1819_000576 [Sarea resinae]|nr:MAG: hypothetical protein M1819_000576 [Sarea resinae]